MLEGYSISTRSNCGQDFRKSYRDGIPGFDPIPEFLNGIGSSIDAEVMIE
jgi:hypothetical protein